MAQVFYIIYKLIDIQGFRSTISELENREIVANIYHLQLKNFNNSDLIKQFLFANKQF